MKAPVAVKTTPPTKKVAWGLVKKKLAERRRVKFCRYAVHAYGRQMWIGRSEGDAERLIGEYARMGVPARKVPVRG